MKRNLILITLGLLTFTPAHAQEQISDRPGGTESTELVEPGHILIELDYLYTNDDEQRTHELPQALIRIAVTDRIEAILGWDGFILSESETNHGDPQNHFFRLQGLHCRRMRAHSRIRMLRNTLQPL